MVGPQAPRPFGRKILSLYYGSDSAPVAVLSTIARALPPANIDIYLSPGIKATLISGRNLPDISTVGDTEYARRRRAAIAGASRMPTTWRDTLQARDPPIRLAAFHGQRITRPCGPAESGRHYFQLTHRMLMRKLSPSFNEAAIVLAGPGITKLIKGPTRRYLGCWRRRT